MIALFPFEKILERLKIYFLSPPRFLSFGEAKVRLSLLSVFQPAPEAMAPLPKSARKLPIATGLFPYRIITSLPPAPYGKDRRGGPLPLWVSRYRHGFLFPVGK